MKPQGGGESQDTTSSTGRTDRSKIPPSPEIIAAVEFLRGQPDAARIRRRYLDLITPASERGGTPVDYSAAERYLLATAARCKRNERRGSPPEHHSSDLPPDSR